MHIAVDCPLDVTDWLSCFFEYTMALCIASQSKIRVGRQSLHLHTHPKMRHSRHFRSAIEVCGVHKMQVTLHLVAHARGVRTFTIGGAAHLFAHKAKRPQRQDRLKRILAAVMYRIYKLLAGFSLLFQTSTRQGTGVPLLTSDAPGCARSLAIAVPSCVGHFTSSTVTVETLLQLSSRSAGEYKKMPLRAQLNPTRYSWAALELSCPVQTPPQMAGKVNDNMQARRAQHKTCKGHAQGPSRHLTCTVPFYRVAYVAAIQRIPPAARHASCTNF